MSNSGTPESQKKQPTQEDFWRAQRDSGFTKSQLMQEMMSSPRIVPVGSRTKPPARNRHVPLIMGIVALGLAAWLALGFSGWWRYIPATLLLAFGWVSLKTALFASDQELKELTGTGPMSEETRKKFQDRL